MSSPSHIPLRVTPDKALRAGTTRRRFLTWTALAAGLATAPTLFATDAASAPRVRGAGHPIALGIASGDPLPDAVILWTRLATDPLAPGGGMGRESHDVGWEVARDGRMRSVVARGVTRAGPDTGHCVHVDVRGLTPGTDYFYRFRTLGEISEVGRTRTAQRVGTPTGALSLAFASCQAWADGHYPAFGDMAREASDVVFHLGDYIYEKPIPMGGGARDTAVVPASAYRECRDLDDYRERYALYKLDPNLQAAHRMSPFITIFDDHEVDNNWAADTPEDDQPIPQFLLRRAAGMRAWWENTAVRLAPPGADFVPIVASRSAISLGSASSTRVPTAAIR